MKVVLKFTNSGDGVSVFAVAGLLLLGLAFWFGLNWSITTLVQYAAYTLFQVKLSFWGVFAAVTAFQLLFGDTFKSKPDYNSAP